MIDCTDVPPREGATVAAPASNQILPAIHPMSVTSPSLDCIAAQSQRPQVWSTRGTPLTHRDRHLWGLSDLPEELSIRHYGAGVRTTIDAVFVPIAGGPHGPAAIQVARRVAEDWNASLTLFTVIAADSDASRREQATDRLQAHADDITAVPTTVEVTASDAVVETLAQRSQGHELIVMGASERSLFGRLFTGPVPERLTDRTEQPIIVVSHTG